MYLGTKRGINVVEKETSGIVYHCRLGLWRSPSSEIFLDFRSLCGTCMVTRGGAAFKPSWVFYIIEGSFLHVSLFYFLYHFTHSIWRVRYGCSSFSFTFCFYYSCWLLIAWFSHSCSYFKDCSLVCVCFRPLIGIHLGRSFDLRKDARELRGLHVLRSAAPHRTFTAYQPNPWSRLVVRVLTKCPLSWISTRKDIAFTLGNASVHKEWKFVTPCAWVWWRN